MNLQYYISVLLLTAVVTFADEKSETTVTNDHPAVEQSPTQATEDTKRKTTTSPPVTTPNPTTLPPTTTVAPETTPKPTVTTAPPPTTAKPTPPPTTAKPTPPPTTPTTAKPTPPPTTSTVAPTTSTLAPTTPSPTPKPAPEWVVSVNGTVCIIANMILKITVPYKSANKTVNAEFDLKNVENATATGTCGHNVQTLTLAWENITSTFTFGHNKENSSYFLTSIDVDILVNNHTFPNNSMVNISKISFKKIGDAKLFSVPMNHSYTCASEKPINLNGTVFNATKPLNVTVDGTITISKVHVEAFGLGQDSKYSAPMDCASSETADIVPIVVGLVLAGLVVVVLIAYLVGRRRAQARGYLSM